MSDLKESRVKSPNTSLPWYTAEIHSLSSAARDLLENYSKITPDQVIAHVLAIVSL
jgi:N-acetyl-anhydromuramyl-L-alanine amidase AmpD